MLENDGVAVLDACVLVPVSLCDTLLRLAEEPALYRPRWSDEILSEMTRALKSKLHRTPPEADYRRRRMDLTFPEAMITIPRALAEGLKCIPDTADRHVLAAAIAADAAVIVTQNIKHFPKACLDQYGVNCQTADVFLIDRYHESRLLVLHKLDEQAAAISRDRAYVISSLMPAAPGFAKLLQEHCL